MATSLNDIKAVLTAHKTELRREYNVKGISVFGSYVRGEQKKSSDEYSDYLRDILDEMNNIEEFVKGADYKKFVSDIKTSLAVTRSLVIGEASKKISRNIKTRYKDIPWKEMAGMRDKLIHEYFGVDLEVAWLVATEELPPLKAGVTRAVKELKR
jgi:uncharacterized protein with HEPN domain